MFVFAQELKIKCVVKLTVKWDKGGRGLSVGLYEALMANLFLSNFCIYPWE